MLMISDCLYCKYFIHDKRFTCKAFPEGVPKDILYNKKKHGHKIEGQTGDYIFEPMEIKN